MPGRPVSDRCVNLYVDGYNFYVPLSSKPEHQYELAWCNFWRLGEHLVERLARELPGDFGGCRLGAVKYFTATIPDNFPKDRGGIQRKQDWLDALNQVTGGRVEVTHGTFRERQHRFYLEREELDQLVRSGIPITWEQLDDRQTFHPQMKIHEEKQTDVMLACSLVMDAALGREGRPPVSLIQQPPHHLANIRPTPAPCHAAVVMSADIDFLPAAEMACTMFACPVAVAFAFPHSGYRMEGLTPARIPGLSTREISEEDLRKCMLPREVVVGGSRTVTLEHFRKSHFQRVRTQGG
jgi:hypothetical protein